MAHNSDKGHDSEIIRRVIDGEVDAFGHLVMKYGDYVMGIVKNHLPYSEVEETAQEVFLKAYQSLPSLKDGARFRPWLASIAVRTCYDYWRAQYRSREVPLSALTEKHREWLETVMTDNSADAFRSQGLRTEARELLDWALEKLSPEERIVLELVYLEERSVKEAAQLLGWSSANVKVRSYRARKKLHRVLSTVAARGGRA